MPTAYNIYEIQIQNLATQDSQIAAGGAVYVAAAAGAAKVAVYDPDTLLPAANPVVPVRGKIRFATLATVAAVDLYGVDAIGRAFQRRGVAPGGVTGGVTEISDPRIAEYAGPWVNWELYEPTGDSVPAAFREVWAG